MADSYRQITTAYVDMLAAMPKMMLNELLTIHDFARHLLHRPPEKVPWDGESLNIERETCPKCSGQGYGKCPCCGTRQDICKNCFGKGWIVDKKKLAKATRQRKMGV